jgi:hypothetical protein
MHYGEAIAVFHSARTDVDPDDVPTLSEFGEGQSRDESWTVRERGKRLTRLEGELWRDEWVEPGAKSPRVRGDKIASTVGFIIDAAGSKELPEKLVNAGRWLRFRPDMIMALANRRGGGLFWATRHTG